MKIMNRKIFFIIAALASMIIAGFIVWWPEKESSELYSQIPTYQEDKIVLQGSEGEVIVNDIYQRTDERLPENGVLFFEHSNYQLFYFPESQGFLVSLLHPDVKSTLDAAETKLIEKLGITLEELCTLNVEVTVPMSVNEEWSGRDIILPACNQSGQ